MPNCNEYLRPIWLDMSQDNAAYTVAACNLALALARQVVELQSRLAKLEKVREAAKVVDEWHRQDIHTGNAVKYVCVILELGEALRAAEETETGNGQERRSRNEECCVLSAAPASPAGLSGIEASLPLGDRDT